MFRRHGLNVVHEESEDDYSLSRTLTVETLENCSTCESFISFLFQRLLCLVLGHFALVFRLSSELSLDSIV
ncbi:uncharacterized protein F5147DRAFT_714496 [Suillus discolor]|uniref:Uncharacterized protein n=1 Tax=Suillus discolor TaxID=1912936 RepID=A0A9P7F087_9AGAM|nr:uncharacterized protein F5147DRAFT_714496 [Suillus discolor]KAG2097939.1 hypothetical protein F5147DRAFT_714496 [Suillus discolor]